MQSFLGIEKTEKQKIQEYVNFLREKGYVVLTPVRLNTTSVTNTTQLVDLFYSLLQYYNQERKVHYTKATKRDLSLASKFIEHRKNICGNRKKALQECALIVKCVVENEELYGFDEPLHSFVCFGQDSMKWISDKAISIINQENLKANERDLDLFINELSIEQERESLDGLDSRIDMLKEMLGGLE